MENVQVLEKNFGGPNSMRWRGLDAKILVIEVKTQHKNKNNTTNNYNLCVQYQHTNTSTSKQHSCVQGPLRECFRARRFQVSILLPRTTCVCSWYVQWRLPEKKRVWTQEKTDLAIALWFSKCKSRSCAQTQISVSSTFWDWEHIANSLEKKFPSARRLLSAALLERWPQVQVCRVTSRLQYYRRIVSFPQQSHLRGASPAVFEFCPFRAGTSLVQNISVEPFWSGGNQRLNNVKKQNQLSCDGHVQTKLEGGCEWSR